MLLSLETWLWYPRPRSTSSYILAIRGNSLSFEARNISGKKEQPLCTPLSQSITWPFNFQSEWLGDLLIKILQPGKGLETLRAFPHLTLKTSPVGPFGNQVSEQGSDSSLLSPKCPLWTATEHCVVPFTWCILMPEAVATLDHKVHRPQHSLQSPF